VLADAARPNDGALLDAAGRMLRRDAGISLIFGGLQEATAIPIRMSQGHRSDRLRTMTIRPERGLGGRSWTAQRPLVVRDYGSSRAITHDYDPQILSESITALAVVPIVVRKRVRGLLYAGSRSAEPIHPSQLARLSEQASGIAMELDVRDEVDRRVQALRAHTLADTSHELHSDVRARLSRIARATNDDATREELEGLLNAVSTPEQRYALTGRQIDVLELVAQGARNDEIARRLGLSSVTVKSYLRDASRLLGARSRLDAVIRARHAGFAI
jgi:LuxR family transcriptional regulator, regulator of acetate metabolism